jgi:lysozyme family protein
MRDSVARERLKALSLRLTEQMAAQSQANKIALEAAEKAVLKAEAASDRRFEGVNEFRQTLSDQAATFITRNEVVALLGAVNAALSRLDNGASAVAGRAGLSTPLIAALVGVAAAVAGVVLGRFFH